MDEQRYCVTFPEDAVSISVTAGTTVLAAAIAAGLKPDAPCGGRGTCGKCLVRITAGRDHLTMAGGPVPGDELLPACQLMVGGDVSAVFPRHGENRILTGGASFAAETGEGAGDFFALAAFDIGTTSRPNTVVLTLTEKGMQFTDHLLAAESVLRESNCRFRMTNVRHLLEQINNQDLPCIGSFVASTTDPSFDP